MANEAVQRQWNSSQFLRGWRGLEPTFADLTGELIGSLQPQAGERILDVGCGGGLSTIEVAGRVGPGGQVTGADISAELLDLARARAGEAGVSNADFVLADVQVDRIPGGPFDAAMSRLGVMFFADFVAAFANIRAHLRPGGRIAFAVFQGHDANPWFGLEIVERYAPPRPDTRFPRPTPLALGVEADTRKWLTDAGFDGIAFRPFTQVQQGPVPETPNGAGLLTGMGASPDDVALAAAELRANDQRFVRDGVLVTERRHWLITARNP
jgi:SAM-dependent methyltransferase